MSEEKEERKNNELAYIEATFVSPMQWHLDDYEDELAEAGFSGITLDDIKDVFIKYGECVIHLKVGKTIILGQGRFGETDYKWPESFGLYNEGWDELHEVEGEEE